MAVKTQWMEQYFISVRSNVNLNSFSSGASTGQGDEESASFTNSSVITTGDASEALGGGNKHFTDAVGTWGINGATTTKVFTVPLKNFPDFSPGQELVTSRRAIGSPVKTGGTGYEIMRGNSSPSTTYEFDVDQSTVIPFLWCLFQRGTTETGVDTSAAQNNSTVLSELSFTPAKLSALITDPAGTEAYATLFKKNSLAEADGHVISDAIVTSATFTGTEGEPFSASFDDL